MRDLLQRPDLFSINTATLGYKTPLPAIIDACAARGIGAIAPGAESCRAKSSSTSPANSLPTT